MQNEKKKNVFLLTTTYLIRKMCNFNKLSKGFKYVFIKKFYSLNNHQSDAK